MSISEISSDWIAQDGLAKLALVVRYALVLWLLYVIAKFAWGYFQANEPVQAESGEPAISILPVRKTPAPNASSLANFHLFGEDKVGASEPVQETVPVDAPDTKLKLVLHGVLSITDSERAQAIISDPAGKEDYYALGALLPGNATLESIHPDRVILKRLGRFETLRMPWESVIPGNKHNPGRFRGQKSKQVAPAGSAQQVLQQLGATQYMQDGRAVGYKIKNPQGFILGSWGVETNDVVLAINGVRLTGPDKIAAIMKNLARSKSLKIELLRDGQSMVLNRKR